MHIQPLVTDNNPSWISRRGRLTTKLFHDQSPRKYGTGPRLNLPPLNLQSNSLPTALLGPVCDRCNKVCKRNSRLKTHTKVVHEKNEEIQCLTCNKQDIKECETKKYFYYSQPKHMLWVLKRTVSMGWFF